MEENRPDLHRIITDYSAIRRRAHEERSRAIGNALASVAPSIWHAGERVVAFLASAARGRRRSV